MSDAKPPDSSSTFRRFRFKFRPSTHQASRRKRTVKQRGRGDLTFESEQPIRHVRFPAWLMIVSLLLVVGVATVLIMELHSKYRKSVDSAKSAGVTPTRSIELAFNPGSANDWKGKLPLEVAQSFMNAKTTEQRLKYVRNPDAVAGLVREFFDHGPGSREKPTGLVSLRSLQTDQMAIEEFRADMKSGPSRAVCVVIENETAKVDFKCYARYGSVGFDDLLDGRAVQADEIRLVVSLADPYYNYAFLDDRLWTSFVGQSPELKADLLLYARKGSVAEKELQKLSKGGPSLATLAIQRNGDSQRHRQFEVTAVLARSWLAPSLVTPENTTKNDGSRD